MSDTKIILTRKQKAIIAEALDVMPEDLEEISVKASPHKKTSFRDDFSLIFRNNTATLARMNLTPTAFRIVLYLFSILDYGNILPDFSQSRIARELGLNKSNVTRAFRELFSRKILIRDTVDNQVYLNANLCVKGIPHRFSEEQMDKFCKSRAETDDFDNAFSLYRSGRKRKPAKKTRNAYPADDIPF
ncbi:helix-turn-helix domain-containing protein [Salmonella enterica]|uniref:Helix-turn-helix domain-containing protein n=5 Tax=Salmonella enterica TaxID=28901 RepID=A0A3U4YH42_SALET|nr:helix-turn-helix domain-containing protein [Salmonella enterica]EAA3463020.1 helix-turn-helix domain-containing protein [Salmonella enterica subsp. enterica serovar Miami]EAA4490781.1 helix-turn-helix domain-containing protein [Salmonella enterica subsp. enterica]EAA6276055.1 helix-turn-helix domain-containing protein [Salmonella enterica subsp. enterica serovar Telhashomer]EBM1015065.1 helix-turn-helix domain-containing protein [Salmonella enterica subsp. enterica serovar Paratyphi B]EBQ58